MLQNHLKYSQSCSPLLHYRSAYRANSCGNAITKPPALLHTGKERDSETGFSYFGARYYDSDLMTGWLSVDPMADKYPSLSPYAYCGWNPIKLVDPDGRDVEIVKNDENKTVTIRANFYYNNDEIGNQVGAFLKGLKVAVNSWSKDIRTALKDESLGVVGYNVTFEFEYIECADPESSAKSDVNGIGNWISNDPTLSSSTSAAVGDNRKIKVDFSINRGSNIESNPDFYGVDQYQGTLKHEIGHIFGLYDRDPNANNPAPYIPKDLMTYDQGRNNAVEPFKRIWRSVGLNNVGTKRVLINKNNREIKR